MSRAQSIVLKQNTNVEQNSNAHLDHVVNSIFDVGEQKFDFQQTMTASDDGNSFHVDDYPDLPNLFVETETLNWEEIIFWTGESYRYYKANVVV